MTQDSSHADLLARVAALESRVAELAESLIPADDAVGPAIDPSEGHLSPTSPARTGDTPGTPGTTSASASASEDPFWLLTSLQERAPEQGAVAFVGSVDVGLGHVDYQWARPTEHLLAADWAERAESVAALGHPLRLAILRRLLDGEHTVAQIVDELELGSTGVAYHHLSALQTGGWVTSPRRGSWSIPASRVIPLLAIITALEKG